MVLSDFDFAEELTPKYAEKNDGHAGTLETSRMMAIKPELIKAKGEARFRRCHALKLLHIQKTISRAESTATPQQHRQKKDKK